MSKEKDIINKLRECQNDYYCRDNAVEAYHTILNSYELIEHDSDYENRNFDRHLEELKNSVIIENKELFSEKFAKALLSLMQYMRKAKIY